VEVDHSVRWKKKDKMAEEQEVRKVAVKVLEVRIGKKISNLRYIVDRVEA
jgi:hypothetical protein